MEARQERIAEMVKLLLPSMEESRRKERLSHTILVLCFTWFAVAGVHMVYEQSRPINSNEYAILNSMISLCAREEKVSSHIIAEALNSEFHIEHLQDLKARDWNDALKYLATAHKI